MLPAEADVVLANDFVEIASEKMVDPAVPQAQASGSVALFDELPNECQATLSGLAIDEADKLLAGKVTGMGDDKIEETGFVLGVAKRAQSDGVHPWDVHRAKILAVIS